ncbi:hypothetical protein L596_010333 [Steinernema carpocapsae]|nr:hypothetical protein L596_010333 [Steinernema carpocapsae]
MEQRLALAIVKLTIWPLKAFENNICKDYVTDKFFRIAKSNVLVVLFRKVVEPIAPLNSIIALDDFSSVAELAALLISVRTDPVKYAS